MRYLRFLVSAPALARAIIYQPTSGTLIVLFVLGVLVFGLALFLYFCLNILVSMSAGVLADAIWKDHRFFADCIMTGWLISVHLWLLIFFISLGLSLKKKHYPFVIRNIIIVSIPVNLRGICLAISAYYGFLSFFWFKEVIHINVYDTYTAFWIGGFSTMSSLLITWYCLRSIKHALIDAYRNNGLLLT